MLDEPEFYPDEMPCDECGHRCEEHDGSATFPGCQRICTCAYFVPAYAYEPEAERP